MKPKATLRRFLLLAGSSMLAVSSAHALDGTWSVSTGVATHNWTDTGMWASGQIATGADYTANFTGIDITGTKTISLNGTNRTIGNITFTDDTTSSNKLVISGNILTLERTPVGAVPVITVNTQEIEITSTLAGNDGLVKTGGGALRLNGTNNLTGGLTINAGALVSQNGNRFGTNLITLGDVANTGALTSLQVTSTGPFTNNINVRGTGVNEIRNFSTGSTWSGAIDLGGNLLFFDRQAGTTANEISGVISGTGNLTFQNRDDTVTNVLTLSNANTFTGKTTITSGILSLTHANALQKSYIDTTASATGDANDGLRTNQTTLKLGGLSGNKDLASIFTTTTGGYGSVTAITLDVATGNNLDYSGAITGTRSLTKTGAGTQVLSGSNSYSGATAVNEGTLHVSAGNINSTSGITIASGAHFKYNSTTALTAAITNNGGTISGTGDIGVPVALNSTTDILAPGNSPGIQEYTVGQSWASFTYQWEIDDFNGTVGNDFDQIQITNPTPSLGSLDLTGSTAGSYILDLTTLLGLVPGDVPNFSETTKSWDILTATGGITGFNNAYWTIDASGFTSDLAGPPEFGGAWSLSLTDTAGTDSLVLTYTAIPEPRAALLGGLGMLMLLRRRRRS